MAFYHCAEWKEESGKQGHLPKRGAGSEAGDSANGHVNERIVGEMTLRKKVTRPAGRT